MSRLPRRPPPPALLAALQLIKLGWAVLPLAVGVKRPHGRLVHHGVHDATLDEDTVRWWWHSCPSAGLGIALGTISGVIVLDADTPEGLQHLRSMGLPPTVRARTRRGEHWFFLTDRVLPNSKGRIGPGIDVKAENGYVACAPTELFDGRKYEWIRSPWEREAARLPDATANVCERSVSGEGSQEEKAAPAHVAGGSGSIFSDPSRSGQDARAALRLIQLGHLPDDVTVDLRGRSGKYAEKLETQGRDAAEGYARLTVQWAVRFHARNLHPAVVQDARLEILGARGPQPAAARIHLWLQLLPSGGFVRGVLGDDRALDVFGLEGLFLPGAERLVRELVGEPVVAAIRDGRAVWIGPAARADVREL